MLTLTNPNNYGTIEMSTKNAGFLCQQRPLIHVKKVTAFLVDRGERGFLFGGLVMPKGIYEHKSHPEKTKKKISKNSACYWLGKKLSEHPRWKGGRTKTGEGYIYILKPEHPFAINRGYVLEHRLIVEQQIGRYLTSKEVTHHRGKKDDNQPKMLMAFSSHSAHRRFHKNPENVKPNEIIFDGRREEKK